MKARTEKYATGKYMVYLELNRIGHISGAKRSWLAESGSITLGYYNTKKAAIDAIAEFEFARAQT